MNLLIIGVRGQAFKAGATVAVDPLKLAFFLSVLALAAVFVEAAMLPIGGGALSVSTLALAAAVTLWAAVDEWIVYRIDKGVTV